MDRIEETFNRLEEVKRLFEKALEKAKKDVLAAKEELTRPLSFDEIREREENPWK